VKALLIATSTLPIRLVHPDVSYEVAPDIHDGDVARGLDLPRLRFARRDDAARVLEGDRLKSQHGGVSPVSGKSVRHHLPGWAFPAMRLGGEVCGDDVCDRGLQLVVPGPSPRPVAVHHRLEALARDERRIVLLRPANLGVHHAHSFEEIRLGRTRHQARHRNSRILDYRGAARS